MRRLLRLASVLALASCGERTAPVPQPRGAAAGAAGALSAPVADAAAALGEVQRLRCSGCHVCDAGDPAESPLARIPLHAAAAAWTGASLDSFLRGHHGGDDAPALAAFVRSLADGEGDGRAVATVGDAAFARGQQRWRELACAVCHAPDGIEELAARTDHAQVVRFLRDPAVRRPDLVHDFGLDAGDANALAAWLLRAQRRDADTAAARGVRFECFELRIEDDGLPALDALVPAATGTCEAPTVDVRTRDDHLALRFTGYVIAPADGDYTFATGSDDSSWLWIDDALVVRNEHLSPHRRRDGTVHLAAGAHALRVVYTEAAGDQSLEVLWRGPGFDLRPLGGDALTLQPATLEPADVARPEDAPRDVGRGHVAFEVRRCSGCHAASGGGLAAPDPIGWPARSDRDCPEAPRGRELARILATVPRARLRAPAVQLTAALHRDGCDRCHARDGRGGIPPARRGDLVQIEDLGDEARLPPDLTHAGARLRAAWLGRVLRDGHAARPYLRVRMPRLGPERAKDYVALFAAADANGATDPEPPFSAAAVERGRELVGNAGRNCVTCHPFDGRPASGAQGMDLAIQYERLQSSWFREWLLHPTTLRPGTRMPALWWEDGEADRADVDAIRCWSSLGAAAPVPAGLRSTAGLVLDPIERPLLHGAFLDGLSARCLAVGSPLRVHWAYDLAHARLAWVWRGAFLDADGTWSGRAGRLLRPLGTDWIVLDDLELRDDAASPASSSPSPRRVLGSTLDAAGYPTFRLRVGTAVVDDAPRARLCDGGSELARTLRCVAGTLRVGAAPQSGGARVTIDGAPAAPRTLHAGEAVELVYRW